MPLPKVSSCIVCEGVRPEPHRKAVIFGFYGVTPDVKVLVQELGKPIQVIILLLSVRGPSDDLPIYARITAPDGSTVVTSEGQPTKTVGVLPPDVGALVAIGFAGLTLTQEGTHKIHILIQEQIVFETSFDVAEGLFD